MEMGKIFFSPKIEVKKLQASPKPSSRTQLLLLLMFSPHPEGSVFDAVSCPMASSGIIPKEPSFQVLRTPVVPPLAPGHCGPGPFEVSDVHSK